jgi:hypothetical protein
LKRITGVAVSVLSLAAVVLMPAPSGATNPLSEILWPRNVQTSAGPMAEKACGDNPDPNSVPANDPCDQFDDFTKTDYAGWGDTGNTDNERSSWVADPAGSGKIVAKLFVQANDEAEQYPGTGTRDNIWMGVHDQSPGDSAYFGLGFLIPNDFNYLYGDPSGSHDWLLLWQNHGDSADPPPQALELRDSNCLLGYHTYRNHLCFKIQTTTATYFINLGAVRNQQVNHENHWGYLTLYVVFDHQGNGIVRGWFSWDTMPSTSDTPFVNQTVSTLYDENDGFPGFLVYRETDSSSSVQQIVYYCGFHRVGVLSSSKVSLPNCP